jgi:hypothetical protein
MKFRSYRRPGPNPKQNANCYGYVLAIAQSMTEIGEAWLEYKSGGR